jgi:hypothetical protein
MYAPEGVQLQLCALSSPPEGQAVATCALIQCYTTINQGYTRALNIPDRKYFSPQYAPYVATFFVSIHGTKG